jgi:hypothetical protein
MSLDLEPGGLRGSVNQLLEVADRHRRSALGHEQERRSAFGFTVQATQCPQLTAGQGMRRWRSVLKGYGQNVLDLVRPALRRATEAFRNGIEQLREQRTVMQSKPDTVLAMGMILSLIRTGVDPDVTLDDYLKVLSQKREISKRFETWTQAPPPA